MMQWHPLFAKMLRPLVEEHYEVQTGVPVGDAPRAADLVLVRRTSDRSPPFTGFLHHLTTWNIIEFKGRTVSPRLRDLDLLVELGLGIDRRLNDDRTRQGEDPVEAAEVSFWYVANHLGRRFLRDARDLLGGVEEVSPGVWQGQLLQHLLFLVDGRAVPVDRESVALHLAGAEFPDVEQALARVLVEEPGLWELYGSFLGALHPNIYREAQRMAKSKGKPRGPDFRPFIKQVGLDKLLEQIELGDIIETAGSKKVIETLGEEKVIKALGMKRIVAKLTAEERQQLKKLLE